MTKFEIIYEFNPYVFHAWMGLVMFLAIPLFFVLVRRNAVPPLRDLRVFWGGMVSAELFMIWVMYPDIKRHLETVRHVERNDVRTAVGIVTQVTPVVCNNPRETFVVASVRFENDDCGVVPGYVQGPGGHLRNGVVASVTYFDSSWGVRVITKVEVEAPASRSSSKRATQWNL